MNTETAEAITRWSPKGLSPEVVELTRAVVAHASPESAARARALLFAAGRLFAFSEAVGLELSAALLAPSMIERFIASGCGACSIATRRTIRANLRALLGARHPLVSPPTLARGRAKPPYSPAELASYLALADAQPTTNRRRRLVAVLSLGAGAGLIGRELRSVRGTDVVRRSGGLVVLVTSGRPRAVPVRAEYHERLLAVASGAGEALLAGGVRAERKNVTSGLIASLAGGADLPLLDTGRLRSSWLVACVEEIGLRALLEAAGITCPQRLGDLVPFASPVEEPVMVALLGGRR